MNETPTERQDQSAWTKLRRRKVVQWGIAYAAGAWVLMQIVAYFSGTFDWSRQIQQVVTIAILVGAPIVLALAWYHGDRGQQRVTGSELAVLTVLLLVGGGLLWLYAQRSARSTTETATAQLSPTLATPDTRPSIAVLPFENRSDVQQDAYFVDGMHDDILTQLSKVSALRVISRTSVEQFRDTKLSMKEIADQLGVGKILEGGVQRAGDRVRINVQLIDASTDAHLWADSYDREVTAANIFAIQSEVAAAIAGALKTALTPAEQARIDAIPTQNLEAWRAYQLGKQRMASRTSGGLHQAETHFRRAVALDSKFALAWVGLADTLSIAAGYGFKPRDSGTGDADRAVNRALELDPNLAEAWASAGNIAWSRLQPERAEKLLRRAIALNPNYAPAHHWLSLTLSELGRRGEALSMAERAAALDPLSAIINNLLGYSRVGVGRFDDALVAFKQVMEIDPAMPHSYANIGEVYAYGFGRVDVAIPWYEKAASLDPGDANGPGLVARAYWELGDDIEAGRQLDRALAIGHGIVADAVADVLYLARGDIKAARRHAQMAADADPYAMYLIRDHDVRRGDYAGARARYSKAFPHLFEKELPPFNDRDAFGAIDLALVLQHTGEGQQAKVLLDRSEAWFQTMPRLGFLGYGISDVAIYALRGETAVALRKLREAEQAGWRRFWRYYRDFDPNLAPIRNEPEFKAVFADIERDMAQQRARLAARPNDAPLDLAAGGSQ